MRLEDSDRVALAVGAVAVSIAEKAAATRQMRIVAPDSIHWPYLCPLSGFVVRTEGPGAISEAAGGTWSSWSAFGLRAFAAGGENWRSLFEICLAVGRRRYCCMRHFVADTGHTPLVSCGLVAGIRPWLAAEKEVSLRRRSEMTESGWPPRSKIEKSCYQHTQVPKGAVDRKKSEVQRSFVIPLQVGVCPRCRSRLE